MTDAGRESRVLEAVVSLVNSLLDDFDTVDLLTELTEQCTALLDVASAGLLLVGPDRNLHLMTATSSRTRGLELFQLQTQEGPCLECYRTGAPVSVADLEAAVDRWPRFAPAAVEAGFASVHAVPMSAAGTVIGALGLFGTSVGALDPSDLTVGQTLAHVATVAILQDHAPTPDTVLPRLSQALTRQVVVEQAKGVVREILDVSLEHAMTLLRGYARARSTHLTDLSRTLMSDRDARASILADLRETTASPGGEAVRGS